MARKHSQDEILIQLATRIPKELHRELKLFAVTTGQSVADLVSAYIRQGLKGEKPQRKVRKERDADAA